MPDQADPLADVLAVHRYEPGLARCRCGAQFGLHAEHAAHAAEAVRAAFPTEYAVQRADGVNLPHNDHGGSGLREQVSICAAECRPPAVAVSRPVLPWHPIKETL